jgi:putative ABC transport system permease protein
MTLYAWVLKLYPREFRDRFAAGMRNAFAEDHARARARGRLASLHFVVVTLLHAVWFGLTERLPRAATIRAFCTVDMRDAVRSLRATPIVTAVSVLSLALGVGANTALFSILNGLVLKPLPVHEPDRLVLLDREDWTNPIWEQIRDRQFDLFESAGAWSAERFNLAEAGRTDPIGGAYVSGGLFRTLAVNPVVGRPLLPADDVRGGGSEGYAAVISYRFWHQRFGGGPDVLGRRLIVSGVPFTIVGVMPRGFLGPEVGQAMDLFIPLASEAAIRGRESALANRSSWWLHVMARLRPNQSIDAATAALNAHRPAILDATVPPDWSTDYRADYVKTDFTLVPAATGVSQLRTRFEQPLTIIMTVVAAVLMIACANIANLMLARAAARRHDMSVRLALGASRGRLVSQLLAESLLLAGIGGAAGLALAEFGAAALVRQLGSEITTITLDLSPDWRVFGFAAAVALGATLLFGLAPAAGIGAIEPQEALREQSRTVTGDRRTALRGALVVGQVALSFALVAGAGLFVRTLTTLMATPLGFEPRGLLIVSVDARRSQVAPSAHAALAQRAADAVAAAPGVSRASLSFMTPMSGRAWTNRVQVAGGQTALLRAEQMTWINAVTPGWFETFGMRLLAGRQFSASDVAGSERVVIVNEAFVRRLVGRGNPLGRSVTSLGLGRLKDLIIIGVVNDAVYRTARAGAVPTMYLPMAQAGPLGAAFSITIKRGAERPAIERTLTEVLGRVDAHLAFSFRDYDDQVGATLVQERLVAMVSGFFGALAMLLAALGLYGVTSYAVSRRRPEIAVRVALGASTGGVVWLVLGRVATLLAVGTAIGLALSLWAAKFVGTLLFQVDARDPVTLATAAIVLGGVGLVAGWLPARKASRLDPTAILRT